LQADFYVFLKRIIKEKIFSKKFAVVKNKFLSLQPRFFEKIFWRLKKGKKAASIKEYFVNLQQLF
jgi:hypothetical protein